MPLPEKRKGETREAFLDRCMGDEVMVQEFPDAEQRRAVCQRQWEGATGMSEEKEKNPEFVRMVEDGKEIPRFSMVAYSGGLMRIAGFTHPVVVDLGGLEIPSQALPIRLDHERRQGVGHTSRVAVDGGQLVAEGLISRDTSWARDVARSGVHGFPWQASIGAAVVKAEFVPRGRKVEVNGQTFAGPLHVVRRAVLKEISFVDSGADAGTSAKVAAESKEQDTMNGKDTETVETTEGKEAQAKAAEGTDGASNRDGSGLETSALTASDPVADMRAQAAEESKRIAEVQTALK